MFLKIIIVLVVLALAGKAVECIGKSMKVIIGVIIAIIAVSLYINYWKVLVPLTIVFIAVIAILIKKEDVDEKKRAAEANRKRQLKREENKAWITANSMQYTEYNLDEIYNKQIKQVSYGDENKGEYIFMRENMPYGRVNAFLNYFNKNIYEEEPYYYSCHPSALDDELREYGVAITRYGIYVSEQEKTDKESYSIRNEFLPFSGLRTINLSTYENKTICFTFITSEYDDDSRKIRLPENMTDIHSFINLCQTVIDNKINVALFTHKIIDVYSDMYEGQYAEKNNVKILETTGVGVAANTATTIQNETKNLMNGKQGGGYAAEYANNSFDRVLGKNVESTAQILDEHGRQVKAGADRTVDGIEIQTKYYQTPSESISAAFSQKQAIYIRSDGTRKMMQIEVPRDQYESALKLMQKRIDNGEVPNIEPGENAATYVRKGFFTYEQAWNVTKAGTIEGLSVDIMSGTITSTAVGGLTAILIFSDALWKGKDIEEAAEIALSAGLKILGKGTLIYTLTSQLSRPEIANLLQKQYTSKMVSQGYAGVTNPIYELSENLANQISGSAIAQTKLGKNIGLNNLTGKAFIANSIVATVVFGPDLCKAVQGKISFSQLVKNSSVGVSALAAASIGQTLIPIPVLGGMIGGAIGGFVAKNLLDGFIEDDAKKMFRILKEEFIDVLMMSQLNNDEIDEVTKATIGNSDLIRILQDMHASGECRRYAREAIVSQAIIIVLSKRKKITLSMQAQGIEKVVSAMLV